MVYGWIGTHIDISERKRSEREVRRARDAAEAALQNLRETQNSLIEAEKLAALGRLVAGVAHEINNPVGTSLTVASSLEHKSELLASEMAQGTLKRSSLKEFVKQYATAPRSFSKFESRGRPDPVVQASGVGPQQFGLALVRPRRSHRAGRHRLAPGATQHGATLDVDCPRGLSMNSYPGSYGQVLNNLFLNSIAHAFPDGQQGKIAIKVSASSANDVEIVFTDDGCGMTPDVRRQAFDPFFTTRRHQGCTGLGLHIVYSIVTDRLGGRLSLKSEPGKGTEVKFVLPEERRAQYEMRRRYGKRPCPYPIVIIRQFANARAVDGGDRRTAS